jgi:hypothetical protein
LAHGIVAHVRSQTLWLALPSNSVRIINPASPLQTHLAAARQSTPVRDAHPVASHADNADNADNAANEAKEANTTARAAQPNQAQLATQQSVEILLPSTRGQGAWYLQLRLRATYTRRLSGELRLTRTAPQTAQQAPVIDATWSLEGDPTPGRPVATGQTDVQGISRFFLRQPGTYRLHLEVADMSWTLPLVVAREP